MSWRVAESLKQLKKQIDAMFPKRSKISDGTIGDQKHKARKSDHNPNAANVVTAFDITFDNNPADGIGVDCNQLAKILFASKDKRIKYLIWDHKITKKDKSGWEKYTGPSPHDHHLHISVSSDPKLYDSSQQWDISALANPANHAPDHPPAVEPLEAKAVAAAGAAEVARTYTVKPGDTVSGILKKFNLKMADFFKLNNFTWDSFDPDNIKPGEVFKVR